MSTKKLYWDQPMLQLFSSRLVSQEQTGDSSGSYRVQLEETAFYPEGGGQPADSGWINGIPVRHVYEEEGVIWHIADSSVLIDSDPETHPVISAEIDWERRYDHMQQHLGQHVLSAAFYEKMQANTIGFHLGENTVTIDLDKKIDSKLTEEIEWRANDIIFKDIQVVSELVDESQYRAMKLRKTPEISESVRIVEISGFDSAACGGTHPAATGSVGLIKILKTEPYKGGSRITFVCGFRALSVFRTIQIEMHRTASLLSAGWSELASSVELMQSQAKLQKKQMKQLQIEWAALEADRLLADGDIVNGVTIIQRQYDEVEFGQLQRLASTLKGNTDCMILLSTTRPSPKVMTISTSPQTGLSMKALLQDHLHLINGTGGGTADSAQGGGDKPEGLHEMMSQMKQSVIDQLSAGDR